PLEVALLHLELGDAVAQEAADTVGALEQRDEMAGAVELLARREARGPRAHHSHLLAGADGGRLRNDPALLERAVDDGDLHRLDRDRVVVDAEHARALARRRAQTARELREVVRGVQPL